MAAAHDISLQPLSFSPADLHLHHITPAQQSSTEARAVPNISLPLLVPPCLAWAQLYQEAHGCKWPQPPQNHNQAAVFQDFHRATRFCSGRRLYHSSAQPPSGDVEAWRSRQGHKLLPGICGFPGTGSLWGGQCGGLWASRVAKQCKPSHSQLQAQQCAEVLIET